MKTAYERILNTMRKQGEIDNTYLEFGKMKSENICMKGDLELEEEDLWIASDLIGNLEKDDTVLLYPINEDEFVIIAKVVKM